MSIFLLHQIPMQSPVETFPFDLWANLPYKELRASITTSFEPKMSYGFLIRSVDGNASTVYINYDVNIEATLDISK